MDHFENQFIGFNDLKQVELSIDAAEKVVGSATMSMDKGLLDSARNAVNDARAQLIEAVLHSTGVDDEFLKKSEHALLKCEEQLNEAMH